MVFLKKIRLRAFLCMVILLFPLTAHSGKELKADAEQLKALFTQRFVNYVTWPNRSSAIPVVAATDAAAVFEYFSTDDIQLVQWPIAECQILFINNADPRTTAALLKRVADSPILTVGQHPDFARMGGVINFVPSGNRFRLQINIDAARRAGLTISSRLLKLADIYREVPQ